ncbi:hypothetical protein FRC07_003731 [Ceratobasidium sp. 392]|nr:hypothetical protein FRC07_003731 [Ceratobasidium sp. 392]
MACTCSRLLLRLRGFYTPTDQSTGREVAIQHEGISMHSLASRNLKTDLRPAVLKSRPGIVVYLATDGSSKLDV